MRAIPLPSAARARSLTGMYPDDRDARHLFARVGDLLVPDDEGGLDALSAATATFAAHLDFLATIAAWLADRGFDPDAATAYVTHIFGQLSETLSHTGINEQLLTDLRRAAVPDTVRRALDAVLTRLRQT